MCHMHISYIHEETRRKTLLSVYINTEGFVIMQFCIVIHKGKRVVLALARAKMTVANGQVPMGILQ